MTQLEGPISAVSRAGGAPTLQGVEWVAQNSPITPPAFDRSSAAADRVGWSADVLALSKPGIVKMVLMTSAVGFALAAMGRGGWTALELTASGLWCVLGTTLSAAGANALNQAVEASRDARMNRTRRRPIPAGRMTVRHAMAVGAAMSAAGVGVLWAGNNAAAALVSLTTILTYVLVYTPMKPVSTLATIVGAVPGALPPLIGWTAASTGSWRGLNEPGGWSLFLIMFVWQVPHFLAIAWKFRDDYARGGFRVLPLVDPTGRRTAWSALLWTATLLPVSLAPVRAMPGRFGLLYLTIAIAAGLGMLWTAIKLARDRSDRNARSLFLASIMYLPAVLLGLVADAALTRLL